MSISPQSCTTAASSEQKDIVRDFIVFQRERHLKRKMEQGYTQDLVGVTYNGISTPRVLLELELDGTLKVSRGRKAVVRAIMDEISSPGNAVIVNNGPFHEVTPIDPRLHGYNPTLIFFTLADAQDFVRRAIDIQQVISRGADSDDSGHKYI